MSAPIILALETSSEACSVALLGDTRLWSRHRVAPRQHTELIMPMIDDVLAEAGVSAGAVELVAFGAGPGSFTGVRIAAAVAQGIALARNLPLVAISSLAALAAGAGRLYGVRRVLSALDARRGEVYTGAYRCAGSLWECVAPDSVLAPAALAPPRGDQPWFAAGQGWIAHAAHFNAACTALPRVRLAYPLAEDVARLARAAESTAWIHAADALPVYLRGPLD